MSKLFSNRYNSLYIDEDDTDDGIKPTKNISRKASKILREIELLKKKTTLTQEEKVKISKEEYWKEILYPKVKESEPNPKPNWKEIKKERKRLLEEERLKKEKEERDRIRREYDEQERIRREQVQLRIEQLRLLREEEEKNIMIDIHNITIQTITNNKIEKMFRILVKSGLSVEKTFKILSRKIHPDKNPRHRELATEKQKYLSQIRDKYTY
jgi:FMN phosphatase YigB (HAD superfamily)